MKRFNPLEGIFEAAKDNWLEKELESYGAKEPEDFIQKTENKCVACKQHVDLAKNGRSLGVVKYGTGPEETFVHNYCEKAYDIDSLVGVAAPKKSAEWESGEPGALSRYIENNILANTKCGCFGKTSVIEWMRYEYFNTHDMNWLHTVAQWCASGSGDIFREHIMRIRNQDTGLSLKNVVGGNLKGLRKYTEAYYAIKKLAGKGTEMFGHRYHYSLEPSFFYNIPEIYRKYRANGDSNTVHQFSAVLKLLLSYADTRSYYQTQDLHDPGLSGYAIPADYSLFKSLYQNLKDFDVKDMGEVLHGYELAAKFNQNKAITTLLIMSELGLEGYAVEDFIDLNSDNQKFGDSLLKFWRAKKTMLKKLFVTDPAWNSFCVACNNTTTSGSYCSMCKNNTVIHRSKIITLLFEEVTLDDQWPPNSVLASVKGVIDWVRAPKISTARAMTKKQDRRAQDNPRWAVAKFPKEYYRGLRIAPLYRDILNALKEKLVGDEELILAIHGRDGEMIYELARLIDPDLFKRMIYFITSRPLTSDRSGGASKAAIIKFDNYIQRILPKNKSALHVDTGFAGSIPKWFRSQGWDVDDIKLVSTSVKDFALLSNSYEYGPDGDSLRNIVINDLEHAPQRLAKIRDIDQWGKLRYSKYAPGFWVRLYGIMSGLNSKDVDAKGGPKGNQLQHIHNDGDKSKCWACKADKFMQTAQKHTKKRTYSSPKAYKQSLEAEKEKEWED